MYHRVVMALRYVATLQHFLYQQLLYSILILHKYSAADLNILNILNILNVHPSQQVQYCRPQYSERCP